MNSITPQEKLETILFFLKESFPNLSPSFSVVLGSGLGDITNQFEIEHTIKYDSIPYLPKPTVEGHLGELCIAKTKTGQQGLFFKGRFHAYEGYDYNTVMIPSRISKLLGCKMIFITNAAGGINLNFHPGDLVIIEDHLNLSGKNPLVGENMSFLGPRFPDLSEAYSLRLRNLLTGQANKLGIPLKTGIYAYFMGPTYETPAEIRMLRNLGADLVGMSTVPDIIAANHCGLEAVALSCVTNYAAGVKKDKLNHMDVKKEAEKSLNSFGELLKHFLPLV